MAKPVGGEHYPRSVGEFGAWFQSDAACLDYLHWLRWGPAGVMFHICLRTGQATSSWHDSNASTAGFVG